MSTVPRLPAAVADQPANFGSITAHVPKVMASFGDLYAQLWQQGIVAADVKELTRIRNARITDCGY